MARINAVSNNTLFTLKKVLKLVITKIALRNGTQLTRVVKHYQVNKTGMGHLPVKRGVKRRSQMWDIEREQVLSYLQHGTDCQNPVTNKTKHGFFSIGILGSKKILFSRLTILFGFEV